MKTFARKPYQEDERKMMTRWICECQPNAVFKSITGICPVCEAMCITAEEFMAGRAQDLSPKVKEPKYDELGRRIDDNGNLITDTQPVRKPVFTQGDLNRMERDKRRVKK